MLETNIVSELAPLVARLIDPEVVAKLRAAVLTNETAGEPNFPKPHGRA